MTLHRNITAVEHQVRPKGLGLGADRSMIKDLEPSKQKQPPKPGDERAKEEELVMGPGSYVLVESGSYKHKYGKVEGFSECLDLEVNSLSINSTSLCVVLQIEGVYPDNARVVVKLAIGGKTVDISQYVVKLVGRKEYDRYSKDLSKWCWAFTVSD